MVSAGLKYFQPGIQLQYNKLNQALRTGYNPGFSTKGRRVLSWTTALHRAFPNRFFINELGQGIRSNDKI
jgi:hypothetical protein